VVTCEVKRLSDIFTSRVNTVTTADNKSVYVTGWVWRNKKRHSDDRHMTEKLCVSMYPASAYQQQTCAPYLVTLWFWT